MPRIVTEQPCSGRPLNVFIPSATNNGFVDTVWTELAEAPDFSIPASSNSGAVADALRPEREVRPGELYFESPLIAHNSTNTARWIQLEMILPSTGAGFETGHFIPAGAGGGASGRVFMVPRLATSARLYDVATNTLSAPSGVFPSNSFLGSVKLNDNRIYMIPHGYGANQTARIYDPVAGTYSTPNGAFPVQQGQYNGVLMADGKVFIVPFADTVARIYDPVANTLTVAGGTFGPYLHLAAVRLASGKILLLPYRAGRAAIYDPVANTRTEVGPTYTDFLPFSGAVPLVGTPEKVFLVPFASQRGAIFDTSNDTITLVNQDNWGVSIRGSYWNGIRLADGRVYMPGNRDPQGRIWDPATDTSTVPAGQFSVDSDHRGLVTLADGKIYLIPYNGITAKIYDPVANTLTTPSGDFPSIAERVAITAQLPVPANGTTAIPIQGQRLLCPARANPDSQGGKLVIRAEVNNAIKVFGSAVELEAASHAPGTES